MAQPVYNQATESFEVIGALDGIFQEIRITQPTAWDYHFAGNVQIPEICFYSVTGSCMNEVTGCPRLHAKRHYHWQISDDLKKWANLPPPQIEALENAFCNPAEDNVFIPPLLDSNAVPVDWLQSVMGSRLWTADLEKMVLTTPGIFTFFHLRRLCTEKIPGRVIKSSNFEWFFCDANLNWIKYGRRDTSAKGTLVSNTTSSEIEEHYISKPDLPLTIRVSENTYSKNVIHKVSENTCIINFRYMIQTNTNSGFQRNLRRRPEFDRSIPDMCSFPIDVREACRKHFSVALIDEKSSQDEDKSVKFWPSDYSVNYLPNVTNCASRELQYHSGYTFQDLPSFWEPLDPLEKFRRVLVSPMCEEYRIIVNYLKRYFSPKLKRVERIQHPFLWRAFQNKIADMMLSYQDEAKVNVRWLFHGTVKEVVDNIIHENFDWRLHGSRVGQMHGQGTYFATNATLAYNYCEADSEDNMYLFIARVAVGTVAKGDIKTVRPPVNPETGMPFDSTGTRSIIVKYDKQEYYPEYLLTFT